MTEKFVVQLIGVIIFGAVMESAWRLAPSLVVFVGMSMLAQMYIHSFPKEVRMLKKESNFAKEMKMFKK